ncbi:unnamed protein product [Effrenium voratum]|nr:unnamed protein product [Effrenium voratum]
MKLAPRNRPTSSRGQDRHGDPRRRCSWLHALNQHALAGEVNRWLAWCSDEQTGMLQQRPTRVCAKAASFPIGAPQAWTRQ